MPGGLRLYNDLGDEVLIGWDRAAGVLCLDRSCSGVIPHPAFARRYTAPLGAGECLTLYVFVDSCSMEVFANDGEAVISVLIFPRSSPWKVDQFCCIL